MHVLHQYAFREIPTFRHPDTIAFASNFLILLLVDGHELHSFGQFTEYCIRDRTAALCLPQHSTTLLQPLDVGTSSTWNPYIMRS
jgi:hypothetical protein